MTLSTDEYARLVYSIDRKIVSPNNIIPNYQALDQNTTSGDRYFQEYGAGNLTGGQVLKPYERMKAYECLLEILKSNDQNQFFRIHKGTPYYFLGWTAFQIEDFDKALFYMDTAISEDLRALFRNNPDYDVAIDPHTPAIKFLTLDSGGHTAWSSEEELIQEVDDEFVYFSNESGVILNKGNFVNDFIFGSGLFGDATFRTIITTLYSFILEYQSRITQLKLRSSEGGSIAPFLNHLFRGCLVLESLLKLMPPGVNARTLRPAIDAHQGRLNLQVALRSDTFQGAIQRMIDLEANGSSYHNKCFGVTYALRNTTGHQLAWSDALANDEQTYQGLYRCVLGSIFWSIYKLWIE